jgi:ribosome-associated protein
MRQVEIRGDLITLGQLLKLAGIIGSGGEARDYLAEAQVVVNGESEHRRGRKIHPGDVISVAGVEPMEVVVARVAE